MARVIIIGADGPIGAALAGPLAARGHHVTGTSRRRPVADGRIYLDLSATDPGRAKLPAADVAIFCAAMARFADCREQPALARTVNVTAPAALAQRLAGEGTRVIMLSTSAVFDGRAPHVPASAPTSPTSAYGVLKAEAEAQILALGQSASVLRLTKVITSSMPLFVDWIASLSHAQPIRAFEDLSFSPLRMRDAVLALTSMVEHDVAGVCQVSGSADISYAQAAGFFARSLGVEQDLVQVVKAVDHGIPPSEVPRYTSMDCSRLATLADWVPPDPFDILRTEFAHVLGR